MGRWVAPLAVALVALFLTAATASAATNLLPNAGFESGSLTGWTPVTATGAVTSSAFNGSYAAQLTRKTGATYGLRTTGYPVASTTSSHAYSATVEAHTAGATETLCQRLREYTAAGALVAASSKCAQAAGRPFRG